MLMLWAGLPLLFLIIRASWRDFGSDMFNEGLEALDAFMVQREQDRQEAHDELLAFLCLVIAKWQDNGAPSQQQVTSTIVTTFSPSSRRLSFTSWFL